MTGSAARTRGNGALPALPGCISTLIDLAGYTADTGALLSCRGLLWGRLRRTALLRALWAESDTLLLDEPFTGMDPAVMKKAAAMLKARCGTKPTLLATHDKEAIRELGWKVIELG